MSRVGVRSQGSVLEPGVCSEGVSTAVPVIVQQLFSRFDVPRRHQEEMRGASDAVQFGLAVATLAVVDQATQALRLHGSVHTEGWRKRL